MFLLQLWHARIHTLWCFVVFYSLVCVYCRLSIRAICRCVCEIPVPACVSACMCAFVLHKFQTNEWNQTLIVFLCLLWVCWLAAANTIAFQYKRTTNTVGELCRCQYKLMLTHTCIVSPKSNKTRLMKSWNLKSLYRVYHVGTHIRTHSHGHGHRHRTLLQPSHDTVESVWKHKRRHSTQINQQCISLSIHLLRLVSMCVSVFGFLLWKRRREHNYYKQLQWT